MQLVPGARLGPYEIEGLAGVGGMGEVYRARDTRLPRDVAIKVMGPALGALPEMRRRFDEEGRLAASLDHPRICTVYDVGEDAGLRYLVMECLEGESLASRLARGPLEGQELLGCAIEIADGLAYAHRRGVIHRDLKPGNVFLTSSGVKVVDFGLAKLRQLQSTTVPDVATLKTEQLSVTRPGLVHGTPEYLAPERLQGCEADFRSDIFAFGAVLYEMATGHRAFEADSPAGLIAAIMSSEPPLLVDQGGRAPELEWLIRRCLRKSPDARWQSMSDVEAVLRWLASRTAAKPERPAAPLRSVRSLAIGAAGVALLLIVALFWVGARNRSAESRSFVAFSVPPPEGADFTLTDGSVNTPQLALSPDGRMLTFVATTADGSSQLWIRPIGSVTARPLNGTGNARYPFWSPNSRSIGFFADRQLRRVDLDGGPSRVIAQAPNGRGGTWGSSGIILFAPDTVNTIWRVNADGTDLVQQTSFKTERGDTSHRWPQFLSDGRRFIFFARSTQQGNEGIYLATTEGADSSFLVEASFGGVYAPPRELLYIADGTLMARDVDPRTGRLVGDPVTVAEGVSGSSNFYGAFSASNTGVIAYASSTSLGEIAWFDRNGQKRGVAGPLGGYVDFQLSPDARYLAVAEVEPHTERPDIHILDLVRGGKRRLTTARSTDASAVWSPDGARLVFRSNRERVHDLYLRSADGSGTEEVFLKSASAKYPTDWSPDGSFVVYHTDSKQTGWDIWMAPVSPRSEPKPLVQTPFDEAQGQISPDGRLLAYTTFITKDRPEVYVQSSVGPPHQWQISVGGGIEPRWRADGSELFYVRPDGMLMSVAMRPQGSLDPDPPKPLFRLPGPVRVAAPYINSYDVDPTGQRFVVRVPSESPQTRPLTVLLNWAPAAGSTPR